ncbi:uncharacterized protein [Diabrotica undecimpunctata]|uniref:uncharacterized protein n=1 Tax=Diabrotica undecimpunctata TaxID=50387 RepID=UPI003B634B12
MKLLIIFVAICICGIQFSEAKCCPEPKQQIVITDSNVAAFVQCLKDLVETHNKPEQFQKLIVERVQTVSDKFSVTTETRSLLTDLKTLLRKIYFGLKSVIDLILPPHKDLFDIAAEAVQKVIRLFVHNNQPLVDLLDKVVVALASVHRIAVLSALDILIGPL